MQKMAEIIECNVLGKDGVVGSIPIGSTTNQAISNTCLYAADAGRSSCVPTFIRVVPMIRGISGGAPLPEASCGAALIIAILISMILAAALGVAGLVWWLG